MDLDKQTHLDMDTIVSLVIQSGQVSEGGEISVSRHLNLQLLYICIKYYFE